jgi:hypothetical protein
MGPLLPLRLRAAHPRGSPRRVRSVRLHAHGREARLAPDRSTLAAPAARRPLALMSEPCGPRLQPHLGVGSHRPAVARLRRPGAARKSPAACRRSLPLRPRTGGNAVPARRKRGREVLRV